MNMSRNLKVLFGAFALTCVGSLHGEVTTNEMANADWGYEIHGLGEKGDEVALVFTNATDKTMTWKPGLDINGARYLIVGGGGAGGSGYAGSKRSNTVPDMGGGGGGAGAGFEGTVDVSASDEIPVVVGAGGIGAVSSQGGDGGESSIEVGDQKIVAAGGGGGGRAINSDKSADDSLAAGRIGGCGGGGTVNGKKKKSPKSVQQGGASLVEAYGKAGGKGSVYTTNYELCYGGGGGGITESGHDGNGTGARVGGAGLTSSITGEDVVYGGGGGGGGATGTAGGAGGAGGGGKGGDNNTVTSTRGCGYPGTDGLGGGGGGGTGYSAGYGKTGAFAGGNGGSGVVIIRYLPQAGRVALPVIQSKTYTGETLVADVPPSDGYLVTKNDGGVDVGTYTVTVVPNEGYSWNDGSADPADVDFEITQAQNEWMADTPKITKENWLTTDDPGVLTPGATTFGTPAAKIAKDGGAAEMLEGALPNDPGAYVITYMVEESDNWIDPNETSRSVSFTIFDGNVVPPFMVEKGAFSFVEGDGRIDLSVGYAVHCEVESDKTVDIYAYYAEDGVDTTNEVKIAEGVTLDAVGTGIIPDLKPETTYWVALGGKGGETVAPTTEFTAVTVPGPATGLTALATFTNDPMEFVITGSVTPGIGTTTVYVRWSLNSDALDQSAAFPFSYGDAGAFTQKVAYAELTDKLTWDVAVSNSFESTTHGKKSWDDSLPITTKKRFDQNDVTYTWTGNGDDNRWLNLANWSANKTENFGYPDSTYATVSFTTDAVVDLKGGAYDVKSHQLRVAGDVKVTFKNGTIDEDNNTGANQNLGADGSVITFENMTYRRNRINPATGSTLVFAGTNVVEAADEGNYGIYSPRSVHDVTLLVRDGETRFDGFMSTDANQNIYDNAIIVSNAVLKVAKSSTSASTDMRMAVKVYEGQFKLGGATALNYDGYTFAIPAAGFGGKAPFEARNVSAAVPKVNLSFTVDVSAYDRGRAQPLMKFVGNGYDNGSMTNRTFNLTTIPAAAKDERHARLVWSAEDNTLYYKQDGKGGIIVIIK